MYKAIIAYIPVLHEGYRKLFANHPDARELFLFGNDVIGTFEHLIKDIRRLDPELVKKAIESWGVFEAVHILDASSIEALKNEGRSLVVPNDDLTEELIQKYFSQNPIEKDTIFLRWDKKTSIEPLAVSPDVTISESEFDKKMIALAKSLGNDSPDWWRRLGAIAVKNNEAVLQAHNTYVPSDQTAYDQGDPRGNFKTGVNLESSLAIHAEARLVAEAAKKGLSLQDAHVYVETFPCPPCAKLLAYSGISKLYYRTGYKIVDGDTILRNQGVEVIFVKE